MIAFDLQCTNGHVFEGWFEDTKAYEKQKKKGLVSCPICENAVVNKIPSTFGIMKSQSRATRESKNDTIDQQLALSKISDEITDFVEKNFDNVGTDFAKEALKIHYGIAEPRNIRGVSTDKEETLLKKEGIQIFKFPMPVNKTETDA